MIVSESIKKSKPATAKSLKLKYYNLIDYENQQFN